MVEPIPSYYPTLSVAMCADGAADAIEFYKEVLGASERRRIAHGDKIGHSELTIGDSLIMVTDEYPEMGVAGPKRIGGTPVTLSVYVNDVDATFSAALQAGASQERPVEDQFYGDRSGQFIDPWGHRWNVASHIEDVDEDELNRRAQELMGGEHGT